MATVNYRLYEDRDAEGVLNLFKKNQYYLGKRPVSVQQFRESLIDRGTYFAVIGETEGRIIAYMAAYPTGDGIVCRPHQIVMGGLLVDEEYRGKLFSLSTIYVMAVLEIIKMNTFTTIIAEVEGFRKQSLLMQRYFGSVMVNSAVKHAPGVNQMYNFIPGYFRLFDENSASRREKMTRLLSKANKASYDKEDEIIDGEFVNTYTTHSYGRMRLLNHIPTGIVEEIEIEKHRLLLGISRNRKCFVISKNRSAKAIDTVLTRLEFWKDHEIADKKEISVSDGYNQNIPFREDITKIHVEVEGLDDGFWFYPLRPVKLIDSCKERLWETESYTLDRATGYFTVYVNGGLDFSEIWPFTGPPYLIGDIEPDYGLSIEKEDIYRFTKREKDFTVQRSYRKEGNEIWISTRVICDKFAVIKPKFQFIVNENSRIRFSNYAAGNEGDNPETDNSNDELITDMVIDYERDLNIASYEIPFERFVQEPYSSAFLKKFVIKIDGRVYEIQTDKKARAYLQFNYIGIDYDMNDIPYTDGGYDFGRIRICVK